MFGHAPQPVEPVPVRLAAYALRCHDPGMSEEQVREFLASNPMDR